MIGDVLIEKRSTLAVHRGESRRRVRENTAQHVADLSSEPPQQTVAHVSGAATPWIFGHPQRISESSPPATNPQTASEETKKETPPSNPETNESRETRERGEISIGRCGFSKGPSAVRKRRRGASLVAVRWRH